MTLDPAHPEPDSKDWTWVLDRPCAECGFDAAAIAREAVAAELLAATPRWRVALHRADVRERPNPTTWSVLEYGCHVRDIHLIFGARARLILGEDNPEFENWDQDQTALEKCYWTTDPGEVAHEIDTAGQAAATAFTGLSAEQWSRPGRRSNGSVFTTETLGIYYLHDVVHHLYDVRA
ncbi:maleylpyruvate isomerase N-terminal domain-containing protein [soil metagenome]